MSYMPALIVAVCYIVFQFNCKKDTIQKYGSNAHLASKNGNVYPLCNLCYIGGDTTQINVNAGREIANKIPPLVEIRYGRESYIFRNIDENCRIKLKRGDETWNLEVKQELSLVANDVLQVFFQNEWVHTYTFRWGEVEKNEVV